MLRTGQQYRDSLRDGRQVWMNGERIPDVTVHPMLRPIVDIRARLYDMQHDPAHPDILTYRSESAEPSSVPLKLPRTQADWQAKRAATDHVLNEIGGIVHRGGGEAIWGVGGPFGGGG